MTKNVLIKCCKICFVILLYITYQSSINKSFASCKLSSLSIQNADYNSDDIVFGGYSTNIKCKPGFITPEGKGDFDINCKDVPDNENDEWSVISDIHKCILRSKSPIYSGSADTKISCWKNDIFISNATIQNLTTSRISSGSFIDIKCNSGYAVANMRTNNDGSIVQGTYQVKTDFKIQCLDGKFYGYQSCLAACDTSILKLYLKANQTLNIDQDSIVGVGDSVFVKCSEGGIIQTGKQSFQIQCIMDDNCKSISDSDNVCLPKTYFSLSSLGSDNIVNQLAVKDNGEAIDSNLKDFPYCSDNYLPCANNDILSAIGKKNIDDYHIIEQSEKTLHGGALKVTCLNSAGIANKNLKNIDYLGRPFRIFTCFHGVWDPLITDFKCPEKDCTDNETCGYEDSIF